MSVQTIGLKMVIGLSVPQIMVPLGVEVARVRLRANKAAVVFLRRGSEVSHWMLEDKGSYCVPTICIGRNLHS